MRHGLGQGLPDSLKQEGRRRGCTEIHPAAGVIRADTHRRFFRGGIPITAFSPCYGAYSGVTCCGTSVARSGTANPARRIL